MSLFWKMIEFYKEKNYCKAFLFAAWGRGLSPGELSGVKVPNIFGFLMTLR